MITSLPLPIDTPWVQISGTTKNSVSGWQFLVVLLFLAFATGPLYWWQLRRRELWRWWKSTLFILAWAAIMIVLVAGGVDRLAGDSHATVSATSAAEQVFGADVTAAESVPAIAPSTITVEPSERADGTRLHVPYQGDQLDYRVEFDIAHHGRPAQCRATLSLFRERTSRGSPERIAARITGVCSPR